jgi:hypothetical protein
VVKVEDIHVYRNAGVRHGVVAIHKDRFGHGHIAPNRGSRLHAEDLRPMHRGPEVRPTPAAFVPENRRGIRPTEKDLNRPVVATRPSHSGTERGNRDERKPDVSAAKGAAPRIVPAPQPSKKTEPLPRPPFGKSTVERRPELGRMQQPVPPKAQGVQLAEPRKETIPPSERQLDQKTGQPKPPPRTEVPEKPRRMDPLNSRTSAAPSPAQSRMEAPRPAQRKLPGEPASQLSPNRAGTRTPQHAERAGKTPLRTEQRQTPPAGADRAPAAPNQPSKGKRPVDTALPPGITQ